MQCLALKDEHFEPEEDDEGFEKDGKYFLTGVSEGTPDEWDTVRFVVARHGMQETLMNNVDEVGADGMFFGKWVLIDRKDGDPWALPFHVACFAIFKRVSTLRFGFVDVERLWKLRRVSTPLPHCMKPSNSSQLSFQGEGDYIDGFENLGRWFPVRECADQWWSHHVGSEVSTASQIDARSEVDSAKIPTSWPQIRSTSLP